MDKELKEETALTYSDFNYVTHTNKCISRKSFEAGVEFCEDEMKKELIEFGLYLKDKFDDYNERKIPMRKHVENFLKLDK